MNGLHPWPFVAQGGLKVSRYSAVNAHLAQERREAVSFPFSDLPNHPKPVQAQDLLDSLIVIAQLLHRDGDLRIVADVLDFARQFRAAIQVGAQGDMIFADQLTP